MKVYNALQSVQAILVHGVCLRIHPSTHAILEEKGIDTKEVLVEYWGNYYIRIDKIDKEIAEILTQVTIPTDKED